MSEPNYFTNNKLFMKCITSLPFNPVKTTGMFGGNEIFKYSSWNARNVMLLAVQWMRSNVWVLVLVLTWRCGGVVARVS
jgi:hypothetical protein